MAAKKKTETKRKKSSSKKETSVVKEKPQDSRVKMLMSYLTRRNIFIVAAILVLAYLVYTYKSLFVAATVNGQPISRLSVVSKIEKDYGKQTLENLINESLIRQKAKEGAITVSQDDVNARVSELEQSLTGENQSLDDILSLQGMTREELNKQIEIQIMLEKLLEGQVNVSDDDVNSYLEQYKDTLPKDMEEDQLKKLAREQLVQQKLGQSFSDWITQVRSEANINYFVSY